MRHITHTLTLAVVLVLGFLIGARYQRVLDNVEGLQTLTAVQKNKISELDVAREHLASVVRLREILADNRIYMSKGNVEEMASKVEQVSRKYGISAEMIYAVIRAESSFNPMALSDKGAMGLMQVLPSTAREVAARINIRWTDERILWDPMTNLEVGTYYLHTLMDRFDSVEVALAAYNQGPNRIAALQADQADLPMDYTVRVLSNLSERN
ncbi:MAG TPA: lytic transglycosylase domain-containing protein [Candidatus Polarisedimenticolia bacterium]|nr:lytic transglycosylase domain-containing protein [Candidatus Polarisedimenticolia bacterium]